jgi:hypothetical protein
MRQVGAETRAGADRGDTGSVHGPSRPRWRTGTCPGAARSQQPGARVIAEEFGIAHVAAQRVHALVA